MPTGLSPNARAVLGAISLLAAAPVLAEDYGRYGKETALQLVRQHPGRYAGTTQEQDAAHYMQQRMRFNGLLGQPVQQDFTFTANRGVLAGSTITSRNVVVDKPGSGQTGKTLFVGAHYDSAPSTARIDRSSLQGLDDNASGAGVLTELVRNLSQIDTEHNIRFIAFGAEEYGLQGARHFVSQLDANEKAQALGMINLDSLITGDKMYANAGDRAFDTASNTPVAAYSGLREHAHALAREMGIDLYMNQGDKPYPHYSNNQPYKPYGVGCCSDQEAFDAEGMPVVAFEATNWDLGPDYDGYTQTDNPNIPGGSTWHDPATDNETFLTQALGAERIDQRMRDFARLVTRLIVEQSNADVLQSMKTAADSQNRANRYLHDSSKQAQLPLWQRAAAVGRIPAEAGSSSLWLDLHHRYHHVDDAGDHHDGQLGIYGEYVPEPQWRLGGGLRYERQTGSHGEHGIGRSHAYGLQAYALWNSPQQAWWNTTLLGWSRHRLSLQRRVTLGGGNIPVIIDNQEQGNTHAHVLSLSNELGYRFINRDHLQHSAYWGLNYSRASIDAYRSGERHSRTGLQIAGTTDHQLDTELGYQWQYLWHPGGKPLVLSGRLAYVHLLNRPGVEHIRATSFADGQQRSLVWHNDADRHYGRLQLGVSSQLSPALLVYLHGDTTFARAQRSSAIQLGLQYRF